ncbi:hypothetical protein AAFF_G00221040 [Aldrovandia affinis]|uniref:Uncharacterized protein n=1 Tax=Aldrovandia affinis TaxID=143900 RepID=A0AAD7RFU4_9TELE|nr:hypothetical protein AAFF_G00221040 [Aldrovandia affinis]
MRISPKSEGPALRPAPKLVTGPPGAHAPSAGAGRLRQVDSAEGAKRTPHSTKIRALSWLGQLQNGPLLARRGHGALRLGHRFTSGHLSQSPQPPTTTPAMRFHMLFPWRCRAPSPRLRGWTAGLLCRFHGAVEIAAGQEERGGVGV